VLCLHAGICVCYVYMQVSVCVIISHGVCVCVCYVYMQVSVCVIISHGVCVCVCVLCLHTGVCLCYYITWSVCVCVCVIISHTGVAYHRTCRRSLDSYIYKHTHAHIYTSAHKHACMSTMLIHTSQAKQPIEIYTNTHMHTYIQIHINMHVCQRCSYIPAKLCNQLKANTQKQTDIHIHMEYAYMSIAHT
jgi:hypothetical protein